MLGVVFERECTTETKEGDGGRGIRGDDDADSQTRTGIEPRGGASRRVNHVIHEVIVLLVWLKAALDSSQRNGCAALGLSNSHHALDTKYNKN